jgi:hypothetical protein
MPLLSFTDEERDSLTALSLSSSGRNDQVKLLGLNPAETRGGS